jgi:membrane associated rhomboid family serine protease
MARRWREGGRLDEPVVIHRCSDRVEAAVLADLLVNAGIAAVVRTEDDDAEQAEDGPRFVLEVTRSDAERAAAVLRSFREPDAASDDASGAGLGDAAPIPSSPDPVWQPVAALTLLHAVLLWSTGTRDLARLVETGALRGLPPPDELYRLVTSTFLHADVPHLALNTAYLGVFAFAAIRLFGLPWAALAYAIGGISGSMGSILVVPADRTVVGASGAIFALAATTIVGRLRLAAIAPLPRRERWRLAGLGALLLPGVFSANWPAHLGGVVAGTVLGTLLPLGGSRTAAAHLAGIAALAILGGAWVWRLTV